MSQASRILDHLELVEDDDPVSVALCVIRRVQGKSWGKSAARHMRSDREFTCFDLPDGSILAVNCNLRVVFDRAGSAWPWVLAVPDRATWESLLRSPSAPDFWADCFRIQSVFSEQGSASLAA